MLLLQVFYPVRSDRMLMEQMRYNLLFRWFVGLAWLDNGSRVNREVYAQFCERLGGKPPGLLTCS